MIGPGTGVAPFRSYMQEREELGLSGNTWLFFGEQYFTTDFLYQTEWQAWLKDETLAKLDLAFSRDTEEKIYVQHRIAQQVSYFINGYKMVQQYMFAVMKNTWQKMYMTPFVVL